MGKFKDQLKSDLAYHLLIWILLLLPHGIFSYYLAKKSMSLYLLNFALINGLQLMAIYLNYYLLIPKFYRLKKYVIYYTVIALFIGIYIYLSFQMNNYIAKQFSYGKEPWFSMFLYAFFNICQYIVISFLLFALKEKFEQKKKIGQIQLEKLTTEINYLRAQINPHFLFNTLNNLYGLALEKSDKTPEIILRLSKMMDYMLYEPDEGMVYLKKDIGNLEDYVAIEKIRQGNNAIINFTIEEEISDQKIVPLLFLPLIENGFKHGVNELINEAWLDIHVKVSADIAELTVRNNYKHKDNDSPGDRGGIGLENLRRRLELFYPGKHQLTIKQNDLVYESRLQINFT